MQTGWEALWAGLVGAGVSSAIYLVFFLVFKNRADKRARAERSRWEDCISGPVLIKEPMPFYPQPTAGRVSCKMMPPLNTSGPISIKTADEYDNIVAMGDLGRHKEVSALLDEVIGRIDRGDI